MGASRAQPSRRLSFLALIGVLCTALAAIPAPAQAATVTLSVLAPFGNETFSGNSTHDIRWAMDTDSGNPSLTVDLEYMSDGVPTTIASGLSYPIQTTNAYAWTVPDGDLTNVTVRVCATDLAGGSACDTSPAFEVDATPPTVLSASPAGTNVGPLEQILVRFSEYMNDTSVISSFSIAPPLSGLDLHVAKDTSWTEALFGNHLAFVPGVVYTVTISCDARDASDPGNLLNGCPFQWTFRAASSPILWWTSPRGGERWTGGTSHELLWSASDGEDPTSALLVDLDYTLDGSAWTPIAGPLAGDASHVWNVPAMDEGSVRVRARVLDTRGLEANAITAPFEIDATRPSVVATSPIRGQGGVDWLGPVIVRFDEAMDTAAGGEMLSVRQAGGGYVQGTVTWDSPEIARFSPAAPYRASMPYIARINTTAKDASDPGNALAMPFELAFTTRANKGPSVAFATMPTGTVSGGSTWILSWIATDPEDVPADLRIDLDFSYQGGAFAQIAGPLRPSDSYAWSADLLDAPNATLRVRLMDSQGGVATDLAPFAVDSQVPSVVSVSPAAGTTGVSPSAPLRITFSEPVNAAGGVALRRVAGLWVSLMASWDDPLTLRLTPASPLAELADYDLLVNGTIRDLSVPGNAITPYSSRFRVGSIPPVLSVASPTAGTRWTAGATQTVIVDASDTQDPQLTVTLEFAIDGFSFDLLRSVIVSNGVTSLPLAAPREDAPNGALRVCVSDGAGAPTCHTVSIVLDAQPPRVIEVTPPDGAVVHPDAALVLSFSESMVSGAEGAFTLLPESDLTFRWTRSNFDNDTLIVEHPRLTELRAYLAGLACSARDASIPGLGLGGACPLAWTFTTAATPSVHLLYPVGGERLTGGVLHTFRWVTADEEPSLRTLVEVSLDGGSTWTRYEDLTPFPSGDTRVPYILPAFDTANAFVRITSWDSRGLKATATSGRFAMDATPPAIRSSTPADGSTRVSSTEDILLEFTESMDLASFAPPLHATPKLTNVTLIWSETNAPYDTVRIKHWPIRLGTNFLLEVVGARDASEPGNAMRGAVRFTIEPDMVRPRVRILVDEDIEEGEVVVLDATGSSDNDEIASFRWTITSEDGQTERLTGSRVEYLANDAGRFNVTVEVLDLSGNAAFASAEVEVHTLGTIITGAPLPADPLLGWVALGSGTSSTVWSLSDRGRSFLSRMFLLPLYVKTRGAAVLDNELRGMIRGYILVNPGDCYTDIKRNLQLENGELAYHLSVLEREGIVKSVAKGAKRVYYPADVSEPEDGGGLHEIQARLVKHIQEVPGMSVHDLAGLLGVSGQLALYHLRKLGQNGYVRFERNRMRLRVFATSDEERGRGQPSEDT